MAIEYVLNKVFNVLLNNYASDKIFCGFIRQKKNVNNRELSIIMNNFAD